MRIKIKVTKDILKRSARCDAGGAFKGFSCAVALAIIELFPLASIGQEYIWFVRNDNSTLEYLPHEAVLFIKRFDASSFEERINMPECSFDLNIPPHVISSIEISEVYRVLSESKTLELVSIQ